MGSRRPLPTPRPTTPRCQPPRSRLPSASSPSTRFPPAAAAAHHMHPPASTGSVARAPIIARVRIVGHLPHDATPAVVFGEVNCWFGLCPRYLWRTETTWLGPLSSTFSSASAICIHGRYRLWCHARSGVARHHLWPCGARSGGTGHQGIP